MQRETDKQNISQDDDLTRIINKVYEQFLDGHFDEAIESLEEALKLDFEYPGISSALKCATFWRERLIKLEEIDEFYERGEFLLKQWQLFAQFLIQTGENSERCLFNLKQFVYNTALDNYLQLLEDSQILDCEILLKMGRCFKALGNYEKAIEFMETALQQQPGSAEIMAELADCHALINEIRLSKIFFREAFFIDPGAIRLENLEAGMIRNLLRKIKEQGSAAQNLAEWIPVYGTIFGVFNVKRELKSLEIGKLKQMVYQLEKKIAEPEAATGSLLPRLLNHYFWLIDYYLHAGEEKLRIEEILNKIRELDYKIYKEYTN